MERQSPEDDLERVVDVLARSRSLLFITGAGISADSGLPTYRGIGGLYNAEHPEEGFPIEEILSGEMLRWRPELTWKYLGQIEQAARGARFNRGHEVIAEMESCFERVWTLTQNIDGLHRQAGARNVLEIHGTLHDLICMQCRWQQTVADYSGLKMPPQCPECQAIVRPRVVLFGETLPSETVERFYGELDAGFDAVFSIGTTSVFPYIAGPVEVAHRCGWATIEINPTPTRVSHLVDIKLSMRAAEAMDAIWSRYRARRRS
ncbi:MAG: NAD-dependent protein deacylase [Planctomycetaceae bacterium]|nr:NAD-dependent protein deacylase [Planctomycetaceae bacterium]